MYLLEKKLLQDEKEARKYYRSGKVTRFIYGIIFCVSLFLIIFAHTGVVIAIFSFFLFGASQANYEKGRKRLSLIQNYRLYAERIQGKGTVKAEDISELVCQPPHTVMANLNEMMQRGYIFRVEEGKDFYLYAYIGDTAVRLPETEERIEVAVTCEACGGVTRIPKGKTGVCSYCESKIKA